MSHAECLPLTIGIKTRVTNYLGKRVVSGSSGTPSLIRDRLIADSCYRELTISLPGTPDTIVVYLSPDQRFITGALYDLAVDPTEQVSTIAAEVEKLLQQDHSPELSGSDPRVSIIEFADLQCPYCRQFQEWYDSLPHSLLEHTTLAYKHLPLPQHPWARLAAEYAACVGTERPEAFWRLTRRLFSHQDEITSQNLPDAVKTVLAGLPGKDVQKVLDCYSRGDGAFTVEKDTELAKQLGVLGTPTLFVRGLRILPVRSKEELQQLLERNLESVRVLQGKSDHTLEDGIKR